MKAAISSGVGRYELEDVELLPLGPTDVRVRTLASQGCATDVHARRNGGTPGLAKPHIRGHAAVGIVEETGELVRRVGPGERVVVVSRPQCGECFWCLNGQPIQCASTDAPPPPAARRTNGDLLSASARVGSYAEQMRVAEATVVPVESSLFDDELLMLSCGAGTGFGAVFNTAAVRAGQTAVVLGAGVIGLSIAQACRVSGVACVVLEPFEPRRAQAQALGATAVAGTVDEARTLLAELTDGRGADVSFEAVGDPAALSEAFSLTRRGGDVVGIGFGHWDAELVLPFNQVTLRGRRLLSCQFGSLNILRDIPTYARWIEEGTLDVAPYVGERFALDQVNEALDVLEHKTALGVVVVP